MTRVIIGSLVVVVIALPLFVGVLGILGAMGVW